ncbi:DapH/DapD/GlmU-related protein [Glaciecola sp. MH2013]|uniref:acyltransferase n=1 Tax=Glaciecola sp. MH2013 TaxID=2785524 RepID=UPI00351CA5B1
MNKSDALASLSQSLSLVPGKFGVYLRSGFYRFTLESYAVNAVVGFGTLFSQQQISIASGVYIGPQGNIGMCNIERDCLLGSAVHIMSGAKQHNFDDPNTPLRDQGGEFTKVTIGENTWVGNGALIMADIGKNCVVAAGSVVTKPVADGCIVGGNPAKVLKTR